MSSFFAVFLVLLLASASYAAGRLHGQLSYRIGFRFGYRQGYFDGDRGAWTRRRRETRAAIASVLPDPARPVAPPHPVAPARPLAASQPVTTAPPLATAVPTATDLAVRPGTTYTGAAFAGGPGGRHSTELLAGRHP